MLRWLIVVVLALLLWQGLRRWLERFGFGRLPGDITWHWGGRRWSLPLARTRRVWRIGRGLADQR